jgi:RNA polymerase sigma-70 factor (ECF subfamily)
MGVPRKAESDDELLEHARAGDAPALEALLERHQGQIYRFGLRMCRDPEDAKDVVQETLLAMARGVGNFRGASSLSTWLYTVARSFCLKKHRRNKLAAPPDRRVDANTAEPTTELAAPGRTPEEAVAGKEVEAALQEAIDSLDPAYRDVLVLRDAEGLTAPEVAEVLGLSVDGVKSRLHRARVAVRDRIAPALGLHEQAPAGSGACPDVLTLFSRHVEGEISAEACAEMERHLRSCARCRETCDSLRRTLALCRSQGASSDVPPSVQASVKVALQNLLGTKG